MGVYIKIEKILDKEKIYYYRVSKNDWGDQEFYISINPAQKLIAFYSSANFVNPIKTIDFTNPNSSVEISSIRPEIVWRVLVQAYKAMEKNEFPQYLSWQS